MKSSAPMQENWLPCPTCGTTTRQTLIDIPPFRQTDGLPNPGHLDWKCDGCGELHISE